jgi:hypothetical protein
MSSATAMVIMITSIRDMTLLAMIHIIPELRMRRHENVTGDQYIFT